MAKEPKEPRFIGAIGTIEYTKTPIAGITLYRGEEKSEPTIAEMLDELERADILSARKELLISKLRERGAMTTKQDVTTTQPNPKRYLVDPETGKIDIDEVEGEYTHKDALLVSASIKGKSGQYDAAINLINAAKTLSPPGGAKATEKPKEFYVDLETGIIVHDPDNGEYTLSEARTVSQSMKRATTSEDNPPGSFIDADGEVQKLEPGQPIVIKKTVREPNKIFLMDSDGELREHDASKPIIVKVQSSPGGTAPFTPFPAMTRDGAPITDKEGHQVYVDVEPQMKWLGFQNEQKRLDQRHDALIGLTQTIRENIPDGIQAILATVAEVKGGTGAKKAAQEQPQTFSCGDCQAQFSAPAGWEGQPIKCPSCGRVYSKEELLG